MSCSTAGIDPRICTGKILGGLMHKLSHASFTGSLPVIRPIKLVSSDIHSTSLIPSGKRSVSVLNSISLRVWMAPWVL